MIDNMAQMIIIDDLLLLRLVSERREELCG